MPEEQTPPEEAKKKKEKIFVAVGTRKKAVARATIRQGTGKMIFNSKPLDLIEPKYIRMRLREPLVLAGDLTSKADITVNVRGGGIWGQADAARTAIANAIVSWSGDKHLREVYMDYDRSILVSDSRRTEPHKPSRSSAGPRRSKQQSKR